MTTQLEPAYGKDYKTAKAVREAWNSNHDFIIADMFHPYSGKPMNKEQGAPGQRFRIYFANKTKNTEVQS